MKKKYLKSLAFKWGELVTELQVHANQTIPTLDNGREMHEAALDEIRRLKKLDSDAQFIPCPFCGSENIIVTEHMDHGYSVGCQNCSTYVNPLLGEEAYDKQKYIDFWNTRASISSANH